MLRTRKLFAAGRMGECAVLVGLALIAIAAHATQARICLTVKLEGKVSAGQEWRAELGEGWVFRLLPIAPGKAGYTGWDLVVDREQPAGFPDALLLATPPYNSINQREIGTTFGLRAQDAIGWNPRSFRFLTSPSALRTGQRLFAQMGDGAATPAAATASRRLMELERQSAAGQLQILDAGLTPGVADAARFAENWAARSEATPQTNEPPARGSPTPLGELHWMRFSVTLWLPEGWDAPRALHAARGACSE